MLEYKMSEQGTPVAFDPRTGEGLPQTTLGEIAQNYHVLSVQPGAVIVAPLETSMKFDSQDGSVSSIPDTRELGTAGVSIYGSIFREEYNAALRDYQGLRKYDQMRKSDGSIKGMLRLLKTPILGARWYVNPAGKRPKDKKIADFVSDCIFKHMSVSFPQLLLEILLQLDFGYFFFEKVWIPRTINGQYRLVWKKLGSRHPMDVMQWYYDLNGGPAYAEMYPYTIAHDPIVIPINKLLVFTFDKEAGEIRGTSVLRSVYKHWYYKENLYKIDGIQKERHSIGVPIIQLPPGYSATDRTLADQLGRNLRVNEKAHVVVPPNWTISFAKLEGLPVDPIRSIEHHDSVIWRSVLAPFITDSRPGDVSSQADVFIKATRYIADQISDVFNKYAIPELVDFNFRGIYDYPELKVRRIGDTIDWQKISFALRNLTGSGILQPDDPLEAWIRDEMDLPMEDPKTKRTVQTPQLAPTSQGVAGQPPPGGPGSAGAPGVAGPPRQRPGVKPQGTNANAGGMNRSGA